MKTLHLATITILVLVISIASNVYAQSSSTVSASLAKVSVGLFNITENSPTIVISGIVYKVFSQNIVLTIFNPQNQLISVSQLQSKIDGTFSQSIIPSNPLWSKGNYTVRVTSGSQNLTESAFYFPGIGCCKRIVTGVQGQVSISNSPLSPLKQFKSGITAKSVTCQKDFVLIIKSEDGSPACVRPDTAYILIHRGWAKEISQTLLHTTPVVSSAPCDIPYPQSNTGIAVLYMPTNSTGKICATYHNPDSPTQSSIQVFAAKDVQQMASEITASAHPDIVPTGNSTIVYEIKTGSQAGLYGMSFFCGNIPFAVGYDNQSRIILDDFPWLYKNDICLSQTNVFQITGLSGIYVKYVTAAHRD